MEGHITLFDKFFYYGQYILFALIIIWILRKMLMKRWFAFFLDFMNEDENSPCHSMKADFFKQLSALKSNDPELKRKNTLRILEIGVGTGVNFRYYPNGTNLVVVDPNPHLKEYYEKNRKNFQNINSEQFIVATGDDMKMVPSNSIDVVVMTLVMCSVDKTEETLKEIHRVLTPGGKYFYWEHIKEFKPEEYYIRAFLQKFLTVTGIFPFIFDGCCLNRDMSMALQTIGFSEIDSKHVHTPRTGFLQIISPHLIGTATK